MAGGLLGKDIRIVCHSHESAGCSVLAYMSALEAGADQLDLSMVPMSGGTCQPDLLTMWHALRGTEYDLGIDPRKIMKVEESLKNAMKDYFMPPEATKVNPLIPFFPMPGGALTANTQMLRDNNLMDKYPEIIAAMGEAVAKGGFGTSVTPVSQFYFQQAFNNVMFGPWKKIAEGYGKMVLGYFGHTPAEPDPEVVKIAAEQLKLEPTRENPLDLNDANPAKGRKAAVAMLEANQLPITDENIFIAASCSDKGIRFLKGEGTIGVRKIDKKAEAEKAAKQDAAVTGEMTVSVNGKSFGVKLSGNTAEINGRKYEFGVTAGIAQVQKQVAEAASSGSTEQFKEIHSTLPGAVVRILVKPGSPVKEGESILVLEAMKMETMVTAPVSGVLASCQVKEGEQVQAGALLAVIKH